MIDTQISGLAVVQFPARQADLTSGEQNSWVCAPYCRLRQTFDVRPRRHAQSLQDSRRTSSRKTACSQRTCPTSQQCLASGRFFVHSRAIGT